MEYVDTLEDTEVCIISCNDFYRLVDGMKTGPKPKGGCTLLVPIGDVLYVIGGKYIFRSH